MDNPIREVNFELEARRPLHLPDHVRVELVCLSGCLWVTVDGDERDRILEPGDAFVSDGRDHAIVYALQASRVALRAVSPALAGARAARLGGAGYSASTIFWPWAREQHAMSRFWAARSGLLSTLSR